MPFVLGRSVQPPGNHLIQGSFDAAPHKVAGTSSKAVSCNTFLRSSETLDESIITKFYSIDSYSRVNIIDQLIAATKFQVHLFTDCESEECCVTSFRLTKNVL